MIQLIMAAIIAAGVSGLGGYLVGRSDGADSVTAKQSAADQTRRETLEAAQEGAAREIAKIKPRNVTIRQAVEREVREVPVYSRADCRVPAAGVRLANEAITGQRQAEPAPDRVVPRADRPDYSLRRGD